MAIINTVSGVSFCLLLIGRGGKKEPRPESRQAEPAQPSPSEFSVRSILDLILDSTVTCDVTKRDSPLLPRLRADNGPGENA